MKQLNNKKAVGVWLGFMVTTIGGSWLFGKMMGETFERVMEIDWMYDEVDDDGNVVKKVKDDWEYDENGNRILEVDDGRIIFEKYDKESEEIQKDEEGE